MGALATLPILLKTKTFVCGTVDYRNTVLTFQGSSVYFTMCFPNLTYPAARGRQLRRYIHLQRSAIAPAVQNYKTVAGGAQQRGLSDSQLSPT